MVETYLPLLNVFEKLTAEGVDFRLTMSVTPPPLCNMMSDPLLIDRFKHYLNQRVELSGKEIERTKGTEFEAVAHMYYDKFRRFKDLFENVYHSNILEGFKKFQDMGKLEIITCGATHGYLPLMVHKESVNAQVKVAAADYRLRFGKSPRGIWLGECAYNPGDDKFLRDEGIRFFFLESHGILHGTPRPKYGYLRARVLPADRRGRLCARYGIGPSRCGAPTPVTRATAATANFTAIWATIWTTTTSSPTCTATAYAATSA